MQPTPIDAGDDRVQVDRHELKVRERFDLSPSDLGWHTEFPGRRYEILLKYLGGYDASALNPAFFKQVQRDLAFGRRASIVTVHQDVHVDEATDVHAVHRG